LISSWYNELLIPRKYLTFILIKWNIFIKLVHNRLTLSFEFLKIRFVIQRIQTLFTASFAEYITIYSLFYIRSEHWTVFTLNIRWLYCLIHSNRLIYFHSRRFQWIEWIKVFTLNFFILLYKLLPLFNDHLLFFVSPSD